MRHTRVTINVSITNENRENNSKRPEVPNILRIVLDQRKLAA